ncbi:MAG: hypothetical protein ABR963_06375 [Acidimicrobiales bacterium]|jgi:hypothetical protein
MSDRPKPPLTTTTSIWPAAAVLILGVVMLAVFLLINAVSDQGVTTPTTIPVIVGGLSTASTNLLAGCRQPGNPPSNVAPALIVPESTSAAGPVSLPNQGAGDFDCTRSFVSAVKPGQLLGYYRAQLKARGWNLFSQGASNGSPEDLFQKAGSDTFYWVIGVTVTASSATSTHWTYQIYQNSETI